MTVANSWYKLLEEEACLQHNTEYIKKINTCTLSETKSTCWIRTSSSLNRPALHIRSKSSPPDAYSITIARWVGVSMTYGYIIIMLLSFRILPREEEMIRSWNWTDLFESDNVGMPQWPVVYNFPLYILIYLLTRYESWFKRILNLCESIQHATWTTLSK